MTAQIVGMATLAFVISAIASFLWQRSRSKTNQAQKNIATIAQAVQSDEAARKAAAVEKVAEVLPAGLSPEQVSALVTGIASHLPSNYEPLRPSPIVDGLVTYYHQQALSQARFQFWFSVAAAAIGFVWILAWGMQIKTTDLATVWRIVPGAIVDSVAVLFLRQATETRQRATDLYDRLRQDNHMVQSAALVNSIEDVTLRNTVKAELALHMAGFHPDPIDLSTYLPRQTQPNPKQQPKKPPDRKHAPHSPAKPGMGLRAKRRA